MIQELALLLWGLYVGAGIGIATWFYVEDDPWDDHWLVEVLQAVVIAFVWGPVVAWVIVEDELL